MVDDVRHLDLIDSVRPSGEPAAGRDRRGRRAAARAGARRAQEVPAVRRCRRGRAGRGDPPPGRPPAGRRDDLRGPGRRGAGRGAAAPVPVRGGALAEVGIGAAAREPPRRDRVRAARGRRAGVLERRRLRLDRDLGRRPCRDRGDRRLRAAGAGTVRPLPLLHPVARGVLRAPRRAPSVRDGRDRGRGRPDRLGADGRRPLPRPVGASRPAPHGARGRRRGADTAHRPRRLRAAGRRTGVVPAREVGRGGRARRSRRTCCAAARSSTTVPTYRGTGHAW